ncbi:MAG: glycogen debranching N-terminal domain-containing protein [Trueperaceae bacterium]
MTASTHPEQLYAWRGPSLLLLDNRGRSGHDPLSGYYFRETRYLKDLNLRIAGEEPYCCSAADSGPAQLEFSYIYPPVESRGGGGSGSGGSGTRNGILSRGLDLDLRYLVRPQSFEAILRVTNRWNERIAVDLSWELTADYSGLSEAQAAERQQVAAVERETEEGGGSAHRLRFMYRHERLSLSTDVELRGGGDWHWADDRLTGRVVLPRQQTRELRLIVTAVDSQEPIDHVGGLERDAHIDRWQRSVTKLLAPGYAPLAGVVNRAMSDLGSMALLEGKGEEWLTPAAGLPLYPALFGRDALTASWQAAVFDGGQLVRSTLATLRARQGTVHDRWRDEEPGRIVQQARRDPTARLGLTPFDRYYGDYAAPLMFIIALGQLYSWTGERRDLEENWSAALAALDWARRYGDIDGDGYLEYLTRSPLGPGHQGWKDSDNAIVHADGEQVDPPIAPCEIQGYWHAALQFMAVLSVVMGDRRRGIALWREAGELKQRFNRDFWLEDEGYLALGLDAQKQPIRSLASNAGQCITTGIVSAENLPRLVARLFQPDLYSGWGLRTLSTLNPAYNPLSYHLGSVWAVENGTISFGLRRYGFDAEANLLARSIYDLSRIWDGNRIPECVGGYDRNERSHPGAYPRANSPQAWNLSAFPIIVQAILGMRPVAGLKLLALDPDLPPWLPELNLMGLRVGAATVDLRFRRNRKGGTGYEVLAKEGPLRIVRQPPLNSLSAGPLDRLAALADGVLPF